MMLIKLKALHLSKFMLKRAINKIKNFHIWDGVLPVSLFGIVNQMWTVCAHLCNVQEPLNYISGMHKTIMYLSCKQILVTFCIKVRKS